MALARLLRSTNQSRSTLWVLAMWGHVGDVHEIGTTVWLPNTRNTLRDVDLEFVRPPAKSASSSKPNLHSLALLPT